MFFLKKRYILYAMLKCCLDDASSKRYLSAQKFCLYLKKEWYWEHIFKQCMITKGKLVEDLLDGFDTWFDLQRKKHINETFCDL